MWNFGVGWHFAKITKFNFVSSLMMLKVVLKAFS